MQAAAVLVLALKHLYGTGLAIISGGAQAEISISVHSADSTIQTGVVGARVHILILVPKLHRLLLGLKDLGRLLLGTGLFITFPLQVSW